MNRKALFVIVGVGLFLGLAAAIIIGGKNKSEAEVITTPDGARKDWEGYTTSVGNIYFEYPRAYFISGEGGRLMLLPDIKENRNFAAGPQKVSREAPPSINIEIYPNSEGVEAEVDKWVVKTGKWKTLKYEKNIDVAGIEAQVFSYEGGLYSGRIAAFFDEKYEFVYIFSVSWIFEGEPLVKDFDEILKTVKFR